MTTAILNELDALVLDVDATGDEAKADRILEIHREIERGNLNGCNEDELL